MVIIKLQGGLGNQMFQYALGRKLEIKKGRRIKYDFSFFEHDGNRPFELDRFGLKITKANKLELLAAPTSGDSLRDKIKTIYKSVFRVSELKQDAFSFDERFLKVPGNAYIEGYWQTEKYFSDIRETLINDFSFSNSVNEENKEYRDRILQTNAVSVHFRRGDYVTDSSNLFKVCDWSYYQNAVNFMAAEITNPFFYIFSDEPEWCRKNISLDQPFEVVDVNAKRNGHLDMYLMSQCKHNIIANSSFSWWAAWLNQNKKKLVIAPKDWFSDKTIDTKDIIPKSWKTI